MFARAYFGERYFAPRYFGEGTNVVQPQPEPPRPGGGVPEGRFDRLPRRQRRPIEIEIRTGQGGQYGRGVFTLAVTAAIRSDAAATAAEAAFELSMASEIFCAQSQTITGNAWASMRTTVRSEQPTGDTAARFAAKIVATIESGVDEPQPHPTYSGKPLPRVFLIEAGGTPWP